MSEKRAPVSYYCKKMFGCYFKLARKIVLLLRCLPKFYFLK